MPIRARALQAPLRATLLGALALATASAPAVAAVTPAAPSGPVLTYADLADLADHAPAVVHVRIRKVARLEAERAPGLRPGWARVYVEATTLGLLAGPPLAGSALRYLADVPLDARGKLPKLAKRDMLVFARTQGSRPGELQLIAPDAQVPWTPELEARTKGVLTELLASDAPERVSKVREAIYVPGTLAGAGESQMFLATQSGEPASITVVHQPGAEPRWSVSFSEVVDAAGTPPARDTLAWYRLACFLPPALEPGVNVSATDDDRARAEADYRLVRAQLGDCVRTRR